MPSTEAAPRRRFTVHGDGSSDRVLLPIVRWVLRQVDPQTVWEPQWADLSRLRVRPRDLAAKLCRAVELYECDVLFVHRDQESGSRVERVAEITAAAAGLQVAYAPVVPVRMTEAWLLFEETALRKASGNPHGNMPLLLPPLETLESVLDPKQILFDVLRRASGLSGRRLDKLRPQTLRHQVAELIDDFSPLRQLDAFASLVEDAGRVVAALPAA